MKKTLLLLFIIVFFHCAYGQTTPSPLEKALTDSICNCLGKVDIDKITTKEQATTAFSNCFVKRSDLLMKLADEKHADPTDNAAMRQIGIDIGKNLLYQNCAAFTRISVKMVQGENTQQENESAIEGSFKRIDLKGFNYIVITGSNGNETSFIWLQQFPGSENFMSDTGKLIGKKLKVKFLELEVYLPAAKGYFKVKEITGIDVL